MYVADINTSNALNWFVRIEVDNFHCKKLIPRNVDGFWSIKMGLSVEVDVPTSFRLVSITTIILTLSVQILYTQ